MFNAKIVAVHHNDEDDAPKREGDQYDLLVALRRIRKRSKTGAFFRLQILLQTHSMKP